jgi:hypothetical protein
MEHLSSLLTSAATFAFGLTILFLQYFYALRDIKSAKGNNIINIALYFIMIMLGGILIFISIKM